MLQDSLTSIRTLVPSERTPNLKATKVSRTLLGLLEDY